MEDETKKLIKVITHVCLHDNNIDCFTKEQVNILKLWRDSIETTD